MSIEFVKGDLFEIKADAIAHGVNCKGVMGAGIAKAFRARYPDMYSYYVHVCTNLNPAPGEYLTWTSHTGPRVENLFTQYNPGAEATAKAFLYSLTGSSHSVLDKFLEPVTYAMPLIGCGIGGLEFEDFLETVHRVDDIFGDDINYLIVYNDDNEYMVPKFLSENN